MTTLFVVGVTNAAIATILALVVWCVTRVVRQPPLVQLLWVLVLVKLVTPPLISISWHFEQQASERVKSSTAALDAGNVTRTNMMSTHATVEAPATAAAIAIATNDSPVPASTNLQMPNSGTTEVIEHNQPSSDVTRHPLNWVALLTTIWLTGIAIWMLVAIVRLARFHHALRSTLACPDDVCRLADEAAAKLGVAGRFSLRMTDARLPPLVWPIGRPTIVVSRILLAELSSEEVKTLLAHELAHLPRKDHWLRWLELMVTSLYWWHPVVWLARRMIQQAEEQACDAWVVWAFPNAAKRYASALFKTVQMMSEPRPRAPLIASQLGSSGNLKERIENIMNDTWKCRLTARARLAIPLMAILVLPLSLQAVTAAREEVERSKAQSSVSNDDEKDKSHSSVQAKTSSHPVPSHPSGRVAVETPRGPLRVRVPTDPYHVAPGDVLHVTVKIGGNLKPDPSIADDFVVEPSGSIAIGPQFGRFKVAGMTLEEAEQMLAKELAQGWLNPGVQVTLGGWQNRVATSDTHVNAGLGPDEIAALREHVHFLEEQFKKQDALYQTGSRGGSGDKRAITGYELAVAQADLALAEGQREKAIGYCEQAEKFADEALKNVTASYEAGRTPIEVLLHTARSVSESKLRLARIRRATEAPAASVRPVERSAAMSELAQLASSSASTPSIGMIQKLIARNKEEYDRMAKLAQDKVISASDLARSKTEYEYSIEELRQAQHALEYRKALVDLANAEYQQAVAANKQVPNAVSEYELRRLKIMVELAEAKLKEVAE